MKTQGNFFRDIIVIQYQFDDRVWHFWAWWD
jgi:hypothetical protein